jgi:two-component system, LytTR family, sensor histidine kinase AlgZ
MHPVLERTDRLAMYLSTWALAGAGAAALFQRDGHVPWPAALALTVPHVMVFGFVSLSTWYVCRSTPLRRTELMTAAFNLAASAVVSAALWTGVGYLWGSALARVTGWGEIQARTQSSSLMVFELGVLLYALSLAINYIVIGIQESRQAERQVLNAQVLAREAELRALRAQLDPHFLFNALNSVSALTTADPAAARRMCVLLSEYLRSSIKLGGQHLIRLDAELALARQYLDIERVRFGTRLSVEYACDPACGGCQVPPLLLQPLVENAVTHGIAHMLDGGTIRIGASSADGMLTITIENPCDADHRCKQTGVGLQNVRRRLDVHFVGRARLDVKDTPDVFAVRLMLPCGDVTPPSRQEESSR